MSDSNKWPIKGTDGRVEVDGDDGNNMLNSGDDEDETNETDGGGIDGGATTATATKTTLDNPTSGIGETHQEATEEAEKHQQQDLSTGPQIPNADNECVHVDVTPDEPPPELRKPSESRREEQEVVGLDPANARAELSENEGDKRTSLSLAASRTPPFPMPSPSAKPRTPGILRLDASGKKSRRSSGISSTVEFRNDPELLGEVSMGKFIPCFLSSRK